jgi:hypothetical protein
MPFLLLFSYFFKLFSRPNHLKLAVIKLDIEAVLFQQLLIFALLHDIAIADGRGAVGDLRITFS